MAEPKETTNLYLIKRKEMGWSREYAAEQIGISDDKLERIENEKQLPNPQDVLIMSNVYQAPELCNYYCTHECSIGKQYMEPVEIKQLQQITLEILSNLNSINKDKNIFIDITADGEISEEELSDFKRIKEKLEQISSTVDSLKLWIEKKGV